MADTNSVNPRTARKQATGKGNIAIRQWIDANGAEVELEEQATGLRYALLADPANAVIYQVGTNPHLDRMGAIFGLLTLAGNVVSSTKENEDEIEKVKARFDLIASGTWVDRDGTGGGPRYDYAILAESIAAVKGGDPADYLAKMDSTVLIDGSNVRYPTAAMRRPEVKNEYEKRKPAKAAVAPDLDVL